MKAKLRQIKYCKQNKNKDKNIFFLSLNIIYNSHFNWNLEIELEIGL